MKMLAITLVAMVFILTGQYLNSKMRKRVCSLNSYIFLIENINTQMNYSQKTIMQIICELMMSDRINLASVKNLTPDVSSDFSEQWRSSIARFGRSDSLLEDDKQILISFGNALGITDLSGQADNCRLHIDMLKKQLSSAEDNFKTKSKIITAMSVCSAVVVLIILC